MSRSVKITISLPEKEFKELEVHRNKEGVSRSKFILQALHFWKEEKERQRLVRMYEEVYKRMPENLRELEAWEKSSLSVFSQFALSIPKLFQENDPPPLSQRTYAFAIKAVINIEE